ELADAAAGGGVAARVVGRLGVARLRPAQRGGRGGGIPRLVALPRDDGVHVALQQQRLVVPGRSLQRGARLGQRVGVALLVQREQAFHVFRRGQARGRALAQVRHGGIAVLGLDLAPPRFARRG